MFDKVSLIFLIFIDHKLMIEDLVLTLVLKYLLQFNVRKQSGVVVVVKKLFF